MAVGDTAYMGYASYVGVAPQTSFSAYASATSYFEFNSEGFKHDIDTKMVETINTTRNYNRRFMGNEIVNGTIEAPFNPAIDGICWLVINAMGGTVTSAVVGATVAYTHTINEGDLIHNAHTTTTKNVLGLSFTIQRGDPGWKWQYHSCRVNSLSIKGDIGSEVMINAELIGRTSTQTSDTLTNVAFTDITPVNFTGITIKIGATTTTLSATTYTGFELSLGNNLISDDKARSLGSRSLSLLPAGMRDVKLKLTQRFDTASSYVDYVANTPKVFEITLDSGVTIAAAGGNYQAVFTINKAVYGPNQPNIGDSGVITHELELTGLQDTTTAEMISCVITNATTTYQIS